jgi:hypothetical protein
MAITANIYFLTESGGNCLKFEDNSTEPGVTTSDN